MNFGQIRERFEGTVGGSINAATLAGWIDMAQDEISLQYGRRQRFWYPPPLTVTASNMHAGSVQVDLVDTVPMPAAPNQAILGDGETFEVISYRTIAGGGLTGIVRGLRESTPRAWDVGTEVRETPKAGVEYDLPEGLIAVHEVRDIHNVPSFHYQISKDEKITFLSDGMYYLSYTTAPAAIDHTSNEAEPEVHKLFHNAIVQYCLAKHWEAIAEGIPGEENKAISLRRQFETSIERAAKQLKRIPNQQYTIGFKLWS